MLPVERLSQGTYGWVCADTEDCLAFQETNSGGEPPHATEYVQNQGEGSNVGGVVFIFVQGVTYIMCAIRWFASDHYSFWHGFKELIWAVIPIVNFTYVWDWWAAVFKFVFILVFALVRILVDAFKS